MEITSRREAGDLVVSVKGKIDALTTSDFEKQLLELLNQGDRSVIIDLAELVYITSAGLRSFLTIAKKLGENHGTLMVAALKDVVKSVFEISGFTVIIPTYESVSAALQRSEKPGGNA